MMPLTTNILNLPVAVSLDGTEWMPIEQGTGVDAVTRRAQVDQVGLMAIASAVPAALEWVIDGGGITISARTWGTLKVPFACTITSATMEADQIGSIIIDVWKCTFAQYAPPTTPTVANSICGAARPTIASAAKSSDTSLTGWTTSLAAGDVLTFVVPITPTAITRVTLTLNVNRILS